MDPNETLRLTREAAEKFCRAYSEGDYETALHLATNLAGNFEELDVWLTEGERKPVDWGS